VVLRHKLNDKIIHRGNGIRKMETETGFRFGTRHPRESINESLSGKWKRKPVSVSEPDIPESQSMRVCLWSIVVNSENSDPAKNKRANLPAAGKFARGQKKKIPLIFERAKVQWALRFFHIVALVTKKTFVECTKSYVGTLPPRPPPANHKPQTRELWP
jgi:hypothetical protein